MGPGKSLRRARVGKGVALTDGEVGRHVLDLHVVEDHRLRARGDTSNVRSSAHFGKNLQIDIARGFDDVLS